MRTNITSWQPDTCGCQLHYSWDADSSEDDRVHTPVLEFQGHSDFHRTSVCAAHETEAMADAEVDAQGRKILHEKHNYLEALHENVVGENRTKNRVHGHLEENFPHLIPAYKWSFTGSGENRRLQVEIAGAADHEKRSILEAASTFDKPVDLT